MRALLIMGPTASGKSALALALAELLGGEIVNADSMQVYRELQVLTARPSADDAARVPHALYGHVPGAQAYSAGRYAADAARAIAEKTGRKDAVPEAVVPAEVNDLEVNRLKQDLEPWLRLATRDGFGASARLELESEWRRVVYGSLAR